jgi:hypothetical protein
MGGRRGCETVRARKMQEAHHLRGGGCGCPESSQYSLLVTLHSTVLEAARICCCLPLLWHATNEASKYVVLWHTAQCCHLTPLAAYNFRHAPTRRESVQGCSCQWGWKGHGSASAVEVTTPYIVSMEWNGRTGPTFSIAIGKHLGAWASRTYAFSTPGHNKSLLDNSMHAKLFQEACRRLCMLHVSRLGNVLHRPSVAPMTDCNGQSVMHHCS